MHNKILYLAIATMFAMGIAKAQVTTAMDFHREDCNGNMQHLFTDLDAGNAVILEFFMQNCTPCVDAGHELEAMKADLLAQFPGRVKSYALGFIDSYSCSSNASWVTDNGLTSIPMDSGFAQVAYYGGMGMPTVVILGGGSSHSVLGQVYMGFDSGDTSRMASDMRMFLSTPLEADPSENVVSTVALLPNPASDHFNLQMGMGMPAHLRVELLDLAGRQLGVLVDQRVGIGDIDWSFSTGGLANGSYLLRVNYDGGSICKPLIVVR
jgi:hypothetical protein